MEYLSMFETVLGTIGSSDGPTAVFVAGPEFGMEVWIAVAVLGLIFGIFGLKLMRVLSAIVGLGLGAVIGLAIGLTADLSGGAFIGVVAGCAVVCAVLLAVFKRVGALFVTLSYVASALVLLLPMDSGIVLIIAAVAALILAILAAIFVEPIVIISTSIYGGILMGTAITQIAAFDGASWLVYVLSAALVVVCMVIQSMLQSRKIGKKEKVFSEKYKEEVSMESEVERARHMILDDEDDAEESVDADEEDTDDLEEIEIKEVELDEE